MQKFKLKERLMQSPTRVISLSFILVIVIGSLLLSLPISNADDSCGYLNHLFIATSATCVTGLVPIVPCQQYTIFGQIVILCLIQIGGLGFLTFMTMFFIFAKKRLSFSNRLVMQEALNKNDLNDLNHFIMRIIRYTFTCEFLGACLLATQFVREFGWIKGVYFSIFHSISAFCNAGFDLLGSTSLIAYNQNVLVSLTICTLIILGGIGFVVMFEIRDKFIHYLTNRESLSKIIRTFSLHTKLVLLMTISLITLGTLVVFIFEKDNMATLGTMNMSNKVLNSFFQSITYRTAGFASIDQGALTDISKLMGCLFMIIGGSPAGTAGGIKTATLAVILITVHSVMKGRNTSIAFGRKIPFEVVMRSLAIILISCTIVSLACLGLCLLEDFPMIDLFFEAFSAFGTVGLSANLTPLLGYGSKLILICLMFVGRIGPITMILTFMKKVRGNKENQVVYPNGDIIVG